VLTSPQCSPLLLSPCKRSFLESLTGATTTFVGLENDTFNKPPVLVDSTLHIALPVMMVGTSNAGGGGSSISSVSSPSLLALSSLHHQHGSGDSPSAEERLGTSVLGQLMMELDDKGVTTGALRRSIVLMGDLGQKRAFLLKLVGQAVTDDGGPYRALYDALAEELRGVMGRNSSSSAVVLSLGGGAAATTATPSLLLPFLHPSRNFTMDDSSDAIHTAFAPGSFSLNPSLALLSSPTFRGSLRFLGKTLGAAFRAGITLPLNLTPQSWRCLLPRGGSQGGGGGAPKDLWSSDMEGAEGLFSTTHNKRGSSSSLHIEKILQTLAACAYNNNNNSSSSSNNNINGNHRVWYSRMQEEGKKEGGGEWQGHHPFSAFQIPSTVSLIDGRLIPLTASATLPPLNTTTSSSSSLGDNQEGHMDDTTKVEEGHSIFKGMHSLLTLAAKMSEGVEAGSLLSNGLSAVLPCEPLTLFSPRELEICLAGEREDVDIALLQGTAQYGDGADAGDAQSVWLWEVLSESGPMDRVAFLRFTAARSRLPGTTGEGGFQPIRIKSTQGGDSERGDALCPTAKTCFFELVLPKYSSKEVLRKRLLFAIHNTGTMETDFQ